jgi:hypothetical protein
MTVHQLHDMLRDLDDTREIVLEAPHTDVDDDPLRLVWRTAEDRAVRALQRWSAAGGGDAGDAYVAYRALADLADAAQDAYATSVARERWA